MKPISKIFITLLIIIFLLIGSLFGIAVFFYYHPANIKSFVEKSAARITGTSCSIEKLSYSLKPLRIGASGITFTPGKDQGGFQLEIPDLRADIKLEGPFSQRSLVVKGLKVDGFSLRISRDMDLTMPKSTPSSQDPSTFSKILKGAVALLLFRDISFGAAEIIGGNIAADLGEQAVRISEIQASLNPERLMEITCSTLIDWPSRNMRLIAPRVHMVTDHAISLVHPEIKGVLTAEKAAFKIPGAGVKNIKAKTHFIYDHDQKKTTLNSIDLRFQALKLTQELAKGTTSFWSEADVDDMRVKGRLTYDHNQKEISFEPLELNLEGIAPKQEQETELPPFNLHVRTSGITNLVNKYLETHEFSLIVDNILKANGRLSVGFGPQSEIILDLQDCKLEPEKTLPYLPKATKKILKPFKLSGPINLHGSFDGMQEGQAWRFNGDMEVQLSKNRYAYRNDQMKLHGEITGKIRAKGLYPDMKISAQMKVDDTVFSGKGLALKPLKTSLSISGTHRAFDIEGLTAHIPQARIGTGKRIISVDEIQLQLRNGKVDIEKRSVRLPEILLDTSLLKNTQLALELDEKQIVMQINGRDSNLMKAALDLNLFPSGWQFSGLDSMEGKVILKENRYLSFVSQLGLSRLAFQNQDSSCMGENIALHSKLEGNLDLKGPDVAVNGSIEVNGGEVLYDRFYLDLNQNAFLTTFKGKYDTSEQSLDLANLTAALRDVVAIEMNGTLQHKAKAPAIQLFLKIPRTPLKPVFTQFILDPFKTEKPFLTNLDLEGDISVDLDLALRKKDWIAKGQCRLHDGGFSWGPEFLSLKGIDLDYPVWYQPKHPGGVSEPIKGELSIRSMIVPILPDQPLSIPFHAGPDRLRVKSQTILETPGGQVHIGPILCKGIYGSKPSIDTSIGIRSVEIQPFLSDIWPRPIQGVIDGNLSPVHFEGGRISSDGKLTANIFGGQIIISGLGASGPPLEGS
jgi:hypothetical protein